MEEIEYGRQEWANDPSAALEEAERRIAMVRGERETTSLFLSDLYALEALPPSLADCTHLQELRIGDSKGPDGKDYMDPRCREIAGWELISNLVELKVFGASYTSLQDLDVACKLSKLEHLDCSGTLVDDLSPLSDLPNLATLSCGNTQVSDLSPLSDLPNLATLNCSGTPVSDLSPLSNLPNLATLNCAGTQVGDLSPLSDIACLDRLDCTGTLVTELGPLSSLTTLSNLDCSHTKVRDLGVLLQLSNLRFLGLEGCRINEVPDAIWRAANLEYVFADKADIQGLPDDVLVSDDYPGCLSSIRAHLDDLGENPLPLPDVKLMILGNGQIGKTQISNRIQGFPFVDGESSTHGIMTSRADIPKGEGAFNIWDFGGQDIYLGTHALFLKSRAVILLVWTPDSDNAETHEYGGMTFRNQPLSWWFNHIKRFGSDRSPVIVVQNQLDKYEDKGDHSAVAAARSELFSLSSVAYSARTDDGRGVFNEYLKGAANKFNSPLIGEGRLAVIRQIQSMQKEDAERPVDERRYRVIKLDDFKDLCAKAGKVSDTRQFLKYLHNAGTVFWHEGLFGDAVILDQGWVLQAIYTVFNRDKCLRHLRKVRGRFSRSDLAMLVWDEEGYSEKEQNLFIRFMQSCGICFELRKGQHQDDAEYIAPDLLPLEWSGDARDERWGNDTPDQEVKLEYASLPPSLMRNYIGRIGEDAGLKCEYWQNGLYGYERETGARVLVEQSLDEDWTGRISIMARGGRADRLIEIMLNLLEDEERRLGLEPKKRPQLPQKNLGVEADAKDDEAMQQPDFAYEMKIGTEYFVSYAWKDNQSELGRKREEVVDELCEMAASKEISVRRDKDILKLGDRISEFMDRLASGDRIIVILSDKYLHSPHCMYELFEIWMQCKGNGEEMRKRIRAFAYEDAKIWSSRERGEYSLFWVEEAKRLNEIVQQGAILGASDALALQRMQKFSVHIGDILNIVTDTLLPRTMEDLLEFAFGDSKDWNN